ncbi:MAG: hypothetical protein LCH46_13060 [Proteobacteria bacterium]|nr:hypothetical protein [Pseudomonadota bacterium]
MKPDGSAYTDRHLLHAMSMVKIESNNSGTRIEWIMFGSNWSSLMFLGDFVVTCAAPVTLRYFNAGWFEETLSTAQAARDRIEELLSKADVRFNERTYVESYDPVTHLMPEKLRRAFENASAPEDDAVICAVDTVHEQISVEHVGKESALAQVWGVSPVSFPCQTGHSYDRAVSRHYYEVVRTGKPLYDHVLAAMVRPDGEVTWLGYKRLIFAEPKVINGFGRVKVISEIGPVDIKLL